MFGKSFFERIGVQQVSHFFQDGPLSGGLEEGSLEARHRYWEQKFLDGLAEYRDAVLAEDWSAPMTETEKESRTEELYEAVSCANDRLEEIALEAGLRAGMRFCQALFGQV